MRSSLIFFQSFLDWTLISFIVFVVAVYAIKAMNFFWHFAVNL
jgi:hypothetical protein